MRESRRLRKYRKDVRNERFLLEFNRALVHLQSREEGRAAGPKLPLVFVVGAPRSGTTLMSQLLAYSGYFGHISNFVAKFFGAPAIGARLELSLGQAVVPEAERFRSFHGVTRGWSAPHEFGYFWSRWFDLGQDSHRLSATELRRVDVRSLRRSVASIERVGGRPLAFKNSSWCTLQACFLSKVFPKAVFVVCRRDPLYVAQSILEARRERYGSSDTWWSIRPSTYRRLRNLRWPEQIAGQVLDIGREMDEELARIPSDRVVIADYEMVCTRPTALVRKIVKACMALGGPAPSTLFIPGGFRSTDRVRISSRDLGFLKRAFATRGQNH